jgi:hypothetical protein
LKLPRNVTHSEEGVPIAIAGHHRSWLGIKKPRPHKVVEPPNRKTIDPCTPSRSTRFPHVYNFS